MGDVIKEINGQDVTDPDQLTEIMKKTSGSVTLKVLPSYHDPHSFSQVRGARISEGVRWTMLKRDHIFFSKSVACARSNRQVCYKLSVLILQMYLKAHFTYDPRKDNLIPSRDAGLPFTDGDILQVVNMDDANWWQVRRKRQDKCMHGGLWCEVRWWFGRGTRKHG